MIQIQLSAAQIADISRALKTAREAKKEDITDIAYRIALSPSQLRAIESENTGPFYSHQYFLQAATRYANALNISLPNRAASEVISEKVGQETTESYGQNNNQENTQKTTQQTTQQTTQTTTQENPNQIIQSAEFTSTSTGLPAQTSALTPVVTSARPAATGSESVSKAHKPLPKKQPRVIQVGQAAAGKKTLRWAWVGFASLIVILLGVIKIGLQNNPQPLVADAAKSAAMISNSGLTANAPVSPERTPTQNQSQNQNQNQNPAPPAVLAPAPAASALASNAQAAAPGNGESDSYIRSKAPTWLQIVATSGEKTNLRIGPDEQINFVAAKTAAVVFGRPDAASVYVRGNRVDLEPFIEDPDRRRALVIMREVR